MDMFGIKREKKKRQLAEQCESILKNGDPDFLDGEQAGNLMALVVLRGEYLSSLPDDEDRNYKVKMLFREFLVIRKAFANWMEREIANGNGTKEDMWDALDELESKIIFTRTD